LTLKIVNNSDPGDADHIGGNDWDTIATGINLGEGYSYLIRKSGSTYYAKSAGGDMLSNTNFGTLLTSVLSALSLTGGRILLGPGDFSLTALLTINQNNVAITGCGVDVTRIILDTPTTTATSIRIGTTSLGSAYTLTANATKGQRVLVVASTTGLAAGEWIFLTRLVAVDASSATRYDAEFHKILTVDSSTNITVEDNLMEDFNTANTAAYYEVPWTRQISLSDLTIYDNRPDNTVDTAGDGPLHCCFCYGLYLHNVKLEKMCHDSIRVEGCFDTVLESVYMETPTSAEDDPDHQYGLYITGASTNTQWNGGWANRCRHSITNNTNSGGVYRRGRQRNISVTGVTSYNANVAHFDLHQGALGATFTGCTAIAGQHSSVSVDVQAFNLRSPAVINGCVCQGMTHETIVLWIDADVVGSDLTPGSNRTVINGCSIISTLQDDADTVRRGIVVQGNRSSISITNNNFYDLNQESIYLEDPVSNVLISGNIFHSVGASLSSTNGVIRATGTVSDLIITNNIFGAGTPPPSGRPLAVTTLATRVLFKNNDVNGLTNKAPNLPAASTAIVIKDNLGLNPIGNVTNPINTTNNTIGTFGGSTATATTATDYTVIGSPIMLSITGGTVSDITIKGPAGTTVSSGETSIKSRYMPLGFKVNITHTGAPTIIVSAV